MERPQDLAPVDLAPVDLAAAPRSSRGHGPAARRWTTVCPADRLVEGRGVAALVDGRQVAVFLADGHVHAVGNRDPFTGRNVLSRGILGARRDRLVVISPLYKQAFDLVTGVCTDDGRTSIAVHDARVDAEHVQVRLRPLSTDPS